MRKRFQRRREDFVCQRCAETVKGSGYTNHCPACLWSKHVDVMPGDRAADCGGLMEPIAVELEHGRYYLVHVCVTCGHERRNGLAEGDCRDAAAAICKAQGQRSFGRRR